MITVAEVKACKELCIAALIDEFGDERKGVAILDGNLVESPVVDA